MNKRLKLILYFTLAFSLICVLGSIVVFFVVDGEIYSKLSFMSGVILGIGSLAVSVLAIVFSIRSEEKAELVRRQQIISEAMSFIERHSDEKYYLPFCIIANAYNRFYKFNRKIYNDFIVLRRDVKEEVLKQLDYNDLIIDNNSWIDNGLKKVEEYIKTNDLGQSFLYDGAKYFHKSITHFGALSYDEIPLYQHDFIDFFDYYPENKGKEIEEKEKITFDDYLRSYIETKNNNAEIFQKYKEFRPLSLLNEIYDLRYCKEEMFCFWVMQIVDAITIELISFYKKDEIEYKGLLESCVECETYEDKYLDILLSLYNLHIISNNS